MNQKNSKLICWTSAALISLVLSACGRPGSLAQSLNFSACEVPQDQQESILPVQDTQYPFQVVIDPNFSLEQSAAITEAIQEWNTMTLTTNGKNVFEIVQRSIPDSVVRTLGTPSRSTAQRTGNPSLYIISVNTSHEWNSKFNENRALGLTFLEYFASKTIEGKIAINTGVVQSHIMNRSLMKNVVMHELGHAAGLKHSCDEGTGSAKHRSCKNLDGNHPYRRAMMFPSIDITNPFQIKEKLETNDGIRLACLLKNGS